MQGMFNINMTIQHTVNRNKTIYNFNKMLVENLVNLHVL